jgi:hypothetical protein
MPCNVDGRSSRPRGASIAPVQMATRLMPGLLAALLILATWTPSASASAPNPSHNIKIAPRQLIPCYSRARSYSHACDSTLIHSLNRARRAIGLTPYRLPADFLRLPATEELFILSNLDRIAYSLDPIAGLNEGLDALALEGAQASEDPVFRPNREFPEEAVYQWGSNWAGGRMPVLLAYYLWMYDDGYGSFNLACPAPGSPGCWGHRQNVLLEPTASANNPLTLSMGAATLAGDYTMLIVAADRNASPTYYYTWEEALADGAGRHAP